MNTQPGRDDLALRAVKRSAHQISRLMPGLARMNLRPDDVQLILEAVEHYADQMSNSAGLLEKANVKLSYFFSHNPGIEIFVKIADMEGDIDIYFGTGTANIDVFDLSEEEMLRYTWHGTIGDLSQFLGVLREVFAVLFSKILHDEEGHSSD